MSGNGMRPRVTLVVAADEAGGIGKDGGLPWRLPDDLKFFKRVTMGHPLVMGRKTHESIGRALPGRLNIVISRDAGYQPFERAVAVQSLEEALGRAGESGSGEAMVIGGAEIFQQALSEADRIYLTRVHATVEADTFLPEFDASIWRESWREDHAADASNPYAYSFLLLERG